MCIRDRVVPVRDAAGKVIYQQATPFLAQDNLYKSVGAIKVPSAGPKQLGFSGFFLPTAEPTYVNGPESVFPDLDSPELALSVWEGNLFPGGRPQSVYTPVSYTHLRAHETVLDLVCRLLLEKKHNRTTFTLYTLTPPNFNTT